MVLLEISGKLEAAEALLKYGADSNSKDNDNNTPLVVVKACHINVNGIFYFL